MALSANRRLTTRNMGARRVGHGTIANGVKVYKGAYLYWNAARTLLVLGANDTTFTFAGIAVSEYDTGDGSTVVAEFETGYEVLASHTGVPQTSIGDAAYAIDDADVTEANTFGGQLGVFTAYESATQIWVLLGGSPMADSV